MSIPLTIGGTALTAALALAPADSRHHGMTALRASQITSGSSLASTACSMTLSHADSRELLRALIRVQYQIRLDLGRLRALALLAEQGNHPPGFHSQADAVARRLVQHLDLTARSAQFGSIHIADGSVDWICIQIAPTDASGVRFLLQDCTVQTQGLESIDMTTSANANNARADIEAAIWLSEYRGRYLGLVRALLNA